MQQIQLNIIPFKPVVDNLSFAFYGEKRKGFAPIYWAKLFESFPVGREAKHKNNYSDFQPPREGAIVKNIGFDMKSAGRMPVSGTYVKVDYNKYLLFNNTRYDERATLKPRDYHFPIKVSIKPTKEELVRMWR